MNIEDQKTDRMHLGRVRIWMRGDRERPDDLDIADALTVLLEEWAHYCGIGCDAVASTVLDEIRDIVIAMCDS